MRDHSDGLTHYCPKGAENGEINFKIWVPFRSATLKARAQEQDSIFPRKVTKFTTFEPRAIESEREHGSASCNIKIGHRIPAE